MHIVFGYGNSILCMPIERENFVAKMNEKKEKKVEREKKNRFNNRQSKELNYIAFAKAII